MDAVVLAVSALGAWLVIPRPGGEPQAEAAAVRHGPAIFVDAFPLEGNTSAFPDVGKGVTREIVVGLMRFNDLFVFRPETSFRYGGQVDHRQIASELCVDFVLTGGTAIESDGITIAALLIDARSGR